MLAALALLGSGVILGVSVMEAFRVRRLVRRLRAVALCCHELRGALTAIEVALSRVERSFSTASERGPVAAVRHGYERAVSVAHDMEAARGALPARFVQRPELVDLRDVAGRVVQSWNASPSARGRSIALEWHAGEALIRGYPMRITQALDNLVANAIEHGHGPVTVAGRITAGWISMCVLDRGVGLKRQLDDLGPRSWRARHGHGLVIARHAIELHGGTMRPVRGPFGSGIEVRLPTGPDLTWVRAPRGPRAPRRSDSGAAAR